MTIIVPIKIRISRPGENRVLRRIHGSCFLWKIDTGEETLQAMTFSYPVRNYIQQEQEANAVVQFLLSKENLEQMFGQLLSRQGGILIYDAEDRLLASLGKINADGDDPENTDLFLSEATGEDIRQIKWNGTDCLVVNQTSEENAFCGRSSDGGSNAGFSKNS